VTGRLEERRRMGAPQRHEKPDLTHDLERLKIDIGSAVPQQKEEDVEQTEDIEKQKKDSESE
jgi:hypothetical protein